MKLERVNVLTGAARGLSRVGELTVGTYDISATDEVALVRQLAEAPLATPGPIGCVWLHGDSQYADLARALEARVFAADFDSPSSELAADFAESESLSWFFLSFDRELHRPVGVLRVVDHGPSGFPCMPHLSQPPHSLSVARLVDAYGLDPSATWEVGTVAVDPAYRSTASASIAVGLLYRSLFMGATESGKTHLISLIVLDTLRKLRGLGIPFEDVLGLPFREYPDGLRYQPVIARVSDIADSMHAHGDALLRSAEDPVALEKARFKAGLIEALISPGYLDGLMVHPYGPVHDVAVR